LGFPTKMLCHFLFYVPQMLFSLIYSE
jgi:hypothetical protein